MVVLRISVNFITDMYSVRLGRLLVVDISRIFFFYLIPTAVFIFLRLYSTNMFLRLPFSMIIIEYMTSVFGSVFIRLLYIDIQYSYSKRVSRYVNHLLVYGDKNLLYRVPIIDRVNNDLLHVYGIISPNPMQWEDSYNNIPILGGINSIVKAMKYDNSISGILVVAPEELTCNEEEKIRMITDDLNLNLYFMKDNKIVTIRNSAEKLF